MRSSYSTANGDVGPPIGTDTTASGKCVPVVTALNRSVLSGLIRLVRLKSESFALPDPAPPLPLPMVIGFVTPHDQARMSLDPTFSMLRVPAALSGAAAAGEAAPKAAARATPRTAARRWR